jgi:phosphatidylinositol alpha-1,6-mannosyltransferase
MARRSPPPHPIGGSARRRAHYLREAAAVVAVSEFTRGELISRMGVPSSRIALIVNGVDAGRFQPGPKPPALLARYGLAGKRVLLTVGRLVERKGIDTMLRALPLVLAAVPDTRYLIVGTGEYRIRLEALIAELGLNDAVIFAGRVPQDELVAHYQLCDLFVMPNRELDNHDTEGFGLVFLEANACGKAVIGGRAGGVVEAVRDGETGLIVDGHDVDALAAAVSGLLRDDARREAMGEQGLAVARASSSAERARAFHALCERVAAAAGRQR